MNVGSAKETKGSGHSSMPAESPPKGRKREHEQELWSDVGSAESMIIVCFNNSFIDGF